MTIAEPLNLDDSEQQRRPLEVAIVVPREWHEGRGAGQPSVLAPARNSRAPRYDGGALLGVGGKQAVAPHEGVPPGRNHGGQEGDELKRSEHDGDGPASPRRLQRYGHAAVGQRDQPAEQLGLESLESARVYANTP